MAGIPHHSRVSKPLTAHKQTPDKEPSVALAAVGGSEVRTALAVPSRLVGYPNMVGEPVGGLSGARWNG